MPLITLSKDTNDALHNLVFQLYAKRLGMTSERFEIRIDPEIPNDLLFKPDYERGKFLLTTRYVPIGQYAENFHFHMNKFFTQLAPQFVLGDQKIEKYNTSLHSIAVKGFSGKKLDKHMRFQVTNLIGVRVHDPKSGQTVELIEENVTIQSVRDKVVEAMCGKGR